MLKVHLKSCQDFFLFLFEMFAYIYLKKKIIFTEK